MTAVSAEQAAELYDGLDAAGVRCWVIGGWGVDALLGRVTRPHHDLDLLIALDSLPRYHQTVAAMGFEHRYDWPESRPVRVDGQQLASAFVDGHPDGRELDIHVVDVTADGGIRSLWRDPWPLPADALGWGRIATRALRCASRDAQLAMHTGYELPPEHHEDLRLLRAL